MKLPVGDLQILYSIALNAIQDPVAQQAKAGEVMEDAMRGEV